MSRNGACGLIFMLAISLGYDSAAGESRQLSATGLPADGKIVRLAVVNTPHYSGLLSSLLPEFERQSGFKADDAVGRLIKGHIFFKRGMRFQGSSA